MTWLLFSSLFLVSVECQEPSEEIVVEAHRDMEVYVAPIKMTILSSEVEAVISDKSVYGYTSSYWRIAKVQKPGFKNIWEPITLNNEVNVYDKDTIEYAWDNCNYRTNAKKCSHKNNHMLVETYITIDDHQIVVEMFLLSSDMTVINKSTYTTKSKIHWIRQQEVTVIQQQGMMGSQTITHMPKEELPLKWLIPTNLLDKHIQQAAIGLWMGVKIK